MGKSTIISKIFKYIVVILFLAFVFFWAFECQVKASSMRVDYNPTICDKAQKIFEELDGMMERAEGDWRTVDLTLRHWRDDLYRDLATSNSDREAIRGIAFQIKEALIDLREYKTRKRKDLHESARKRANGMRNAIIRARRICPNLHVPMYMASRVREINDIVSPVTRVTMLLNEPKSKPKTVATVTKPEKKPIVSDTEETTPDYTKSNSKDKTDAPSSSKRISDTSLLIGGYIVLGALFIFLHFAGNYIKRNDPEVSQLNAHWTQYAQVIIGIIAIMVTILVAMWK